MATDGCDCCAGLLEGLGLPCEGCLDALRRRDRLGHPHPLSEAQRAAAEANPVGGVIDTVSVLAVRDPSTDETTVLGYIEDGGELGRRDAAQRN
jgi:hypothetical protein